MDPDCVDFGMGLQLAHHEDGRDRLPTSYLSQFVYVVRASAARACVVFSESSVSHSTHVLARTLHSVAFQYVCLARLGGACSSDALQWTGSDIGLHHADFFCSLGRAVVSGAFAFTHVGWRCGSVSGSFAVALE